MKKTVLFLVLAAALALPGLALAKKICVWQFDSLDRYYEPEVKARVGCTWGLRRALTGLGHEVRVSYELPADLASFDAVFVSLGWSRG